MSQQSHLESFNTELFIDELQQPGHWDRWFDPRIVQPVVSGYTNHATPVHIRKCTTVYLKPSG
jgi:hypothetical protein